VDSVALDVRAVQIADRARLGLARVGRAHRLAQVRHGVGPLQGRRDHRALRHEAHEALVERAFPVHRVESARLLRRQPQSPDPGQAESLLLQVRQDRPRPAGGHRVRLDDRESSFHLQSFNLSIFQSSILQDFLHLLSNVGRRAHDRDARGFQGTFTLSAAVPRPPAMIAPACPIRRPGGAVCPAMKETTGLPKFPAM
jgi:hypothetical protein